MTVEIMIDFSQILVWTVKPYNSMLNLRLFGSVKTELCTKDAKQFSITLNGKMGWWASLAAAIMYGDFPNLGQL